MKTMLKNLVVGASLVAIGSTAAPAMAQGYYNGFTSVPLQGYAPYNNYNYGGFNNGYGGFVNDYGYDPYYRRPSRARRVLKTTLIGAGIGAGAGALYGLAGRGRVLKPALIGGGIGAGAGLGYGLLTRPRGFDYGY